MTQTPLLPTPDVWGLTDADVDLMLFATEMSDFLIGTALDAEEQARLASLTEAGMFDYVAEERQVPYYHLTDWAYAVLSALSAV